MKVEKYEFGSITIDGEHFRNDVIILPPKVLSPWMRRHGHLVDMEDIAGIMQLPPRILIIGTGAYGRVTVPDEVMQELESAGIAVEIMPTGRACSRFNRLTETGGKIAAALHLTC